MAGIRREHNIGRLVQIKGNNKETFIVTTFSHDIALGSLVLHLRRISPLPREEANAIPISDLLPAELPAGAFPREALALLVSKSFAVSHFDGVVFSTRTVFKEYQFRPLMKYLKSRNMRLLIADEAGLGKTIETGYILIEELARSIMKRILIICPAGLRMKWQEELWRRFGLSFTIFDGASLQRLIESNQSFRAICSFDMMRAKGDLLSAIESSNPIDFLVIDEVHHLIGRENQTLRRELGVGLSRGSRRVVGLSATPLQIEIEDLKRVFEVILGHELDRTQFLADMNQTIVLNSVLKFVKLDEWTEEKAVSLYKSLAQSRHGNSIADEVLRLPKISSRPSESQRKEALSRLSLSLNLLNPFSELVTRTRRIDVDEARRRIVHNYPVKLSVLEEKGYVDGRLVNVSEAKLFQEIDELIADSFSHVHRLQLASCLPAMVDLLRKGTTGVAKWYQNMNELNQDLHLTANGKRVGGALTEEERQKCQRLVDSFGLVSVDTKWEHLLGILRRVQSRSSKAIIFTQWIPTQHYLSRRASQVQGLQTFSISGEDSGWQSERTLDEFKECEGGAILITTDLLSEGLDLQEANTVINYDFPYNPQKIEQRIGRVDRIGQAASEVEIHNLWVQGSIEEQILNILDHRLGIFQQALGDVSNFLKQGVAELTPEEGNLLEERLAIMKELNETSLFAGVEDLLDADVRTLRAKNAGSLNRFAWVVVARALSLSVGDQGLDYEDKPGTFSLGPFSEDDFTTIADWIGIRNSALVLRDIEANKDSRGFIELAKAPDSPGLFLPASHPLVMTSVVVTMNAVLMGDEHRDKPLYLVPTHKAASWKRPVSIFRYNSIDPTNLTTTLVYWAGLADGTFGKLAGRSMIDFQEYLEKVDLKQTSFGVRRETPPELIETVKLDWISWNQYTTSRSITGDSVENDSLAQNRFLLICMVDWENPE